MTRPTQQAADFRETLGLTSDQVIPDIVELIKSAGYSYHEADFGDDFFAFTERIPGHNFLIGFNSRLRFGEAFKRFTLAHELGHIAMHSQILSEGKRHSSRSVGNSVPGIEREADQFAAYFLMPARIFSQKCRNLDFSPASIRTLAEYFQVSDISTAMHYVDHTDLACSMIASHSQGITKWERRSEQMKEMVKPARFVSKTKVPVNSLTSEWIQGREVDKKGVMPLGDWMPDLGREIETEESVFKTPDGLFLTLLTPLSLTVESES